MSGSKKILKASRSLILIITLGINFAQASEVCSVDWGKEGSVTGPSILWGIGISASTDSLRAKEESKTKAFADISQQLKSSLTSSMTLKETEKETTFNGFSKVESQIGSLNGIKVVKEGANPALGYNACTSVKLDVRDAYKIPEGKMKALEVRTKLISEALKSKKYLEVLKLGDSVVEEINSSKEDISLADIFKIFLKSPGSTWTQIFEELKADINNAQMTARENIVFVIPEGQYEEAFLDIESSLSGSGFGVVKSLSEVESSKIPVVFELKQVGGLRKTKTALGHTLVAKIMISLRDIKSKKVLATNKGANVIGTGKTEDDALANIPRQLTSHLVTLIQEALPGIKIN